jgi:hypothetical protein
MCLKIAGACGGGRIGFFTPERLVGKFARMGEMIERADRPASG